MTTDGVPRSSADAWGIQHEWVDAQKQRAVVPAETVQRLREVIGTPPEDLEERAPVVTRPGRDLGLGRVEVDCEDGETRLVDGVLPADFPLGYHRMRTAAGASRRLIVSPGRCWLPDGWRAWGWTVQAYAARSRQSWGIGDLRDLRTLREWSAGLGAGFILVNPLHAVAPGLPQEPSPYLPATRRFRNPLYLCVDEVPGAQLADLTDLEGQARPAGVASLIDRDHVWTLKRAALWRVFGAGEVDPAFVGWRVEQGESLQNFAVWSALAEIHGADWHEWPVGLQSPTSTDVQQFAEAEPDTVTFYAWLQWLLDIELRSASGDLKVIQDLPIGVDGGGADAWVWQDTLARGGRIGAPPDIFNAAGQDWGSPPLIPWRLRAADYEPFIESIRATMAAGGGIRIDHVMGLFRLWWVPEGGSPSDGAYVRYPSDDLLDIIALESHRAGALVIGEDLGTVEPGVRETLAEYAMLSYRLLLFEDADPADWPTSSMAAVTTHDLPTVAGLWSGNDVAEQADHVSASRADLERGRAQLLSRLRAHRQLDPDAEAPSVIAAVHRALGRSPSILVSATLEDAVAAERRPNIPATPTRDNWCLPLPVWVDDLPRHPLAGQVAETLREAVRSTGPGSQKRVHESTASD